MFTVRKKWFVVKKKVIYLWIRFIFIDPISLDTRYVQKYFNIFFECSVFGKKYRIILIHLTVISCCTSFFMSSSKNSPSRRFPHFFLHLFLSWKFNSIHVHFKGGEIWKVFKTSQLIESKVPLWLKLYIV